MPLDIMQMLVDNANSIKTKLVKDYRCKRGSPGYHVIKELTKLGGKASGRQLKQLTGFYPANCLRPAMNKGHITKTHIGDEVIYEIVNPKKIKFIGE